MKTKMRERIVHIVKESVDHWNPYGLLPDIPNDEFNSESRSIALKIDLDSTVEEIAIIVSKVFSSSFEVKYFHKEDCMEVAQIIHDELLYIER
jgi:hypothetical protein